MGLLKRMGTGQGWLKAGFLGFPKSGKSFTAALLAIGLKKYFNMKGPIAFYDTEGGAEYLAEMIKKQSGQELVGVRSRSFDDLVNTAREAEKEGVSVLIADSMTHVWRELCDAHLKQINKARLAKGFGQRHRLEFQDWNIIKGKWAEWTDFYLNSKLHIVIAGRAGFEYEFEENEETGKKDLIKSGVKMKTESEFGFEPSLLVEMERVQILNDKTQIVHRATVIGDRFSVIDGAQKDNPTFEFFLPHIKRLVPGAHAPVDTEIKTDLGVDQDGDGQWQRERRERTILCEEIMGALVNLWPGQKAEEKKAKADAIDKAFGTRSWTKVETQVSILDLRRGLKEIRALAGTNGSEAPAETAETSGPSVDEMKERQAVIQAIEKEFKAQKIKPKERERYGVLADLPLDALVQIKEDLSLPF